MLDESKLPVAHFVRSFWNSGHDHVRKNQLYREISKSISNEEDIKQFVDGLLKVCPCYIDLNNSSSGYFKDHDIQQSIQGLNAIGAKIFYPTILACVYKDVDVKVIKILLKTIESLFIRNIVIGPETANSYEESFSTYGKQITEDSSATSKIIEDIKSKIRSDEAFKNDFKTSSIKTSSTARYILTTIYNYENGKEIRINSNPNEVQVEHIMPKSNDKWKVDKEVHSTYLYYIGNQTLLLSSDNTEASNDTFDIKKIIYNRSTLKQNSEYFKDIEKWTTDEIKNRQEELYKTAVKCWLK